MSRFAKVAKAVSTPTIQRKSYALANKVLASNVASADLKTLANDLIYVTNLYRDAIGNFNDSILPQTSLAAAVNDDYVGMGSTYSELKAMATRLAKVGIISTMELNDIMSATH